MNINYIKNNWLVLLLLLLFGLFILFTKPFSCNKPAAPTIVTKTDTLRQTIVQPIQYVPQYQPQQTSSQPVINIPPQYKPSEDNAVLLRQYIEVTNKYLALNTYKDSIVLKDSTGNRVGVVNLEDGVSENQIKFRKPNYQLAFPRTIITNTTTITQPAKLRNKWYFGGGINGNVSEIVNGANAGIIFQNKADNIYQLSAGFISIPTQGLKPQFGVSFYKKIKLHK